MAKKSGNSSKSYSHYDIVKLLSFIAIILAAIIWLLIALDKIFDWKWAVIGTLQFIQYLCAFGALALAAYPLARSKGTGSAGFIIYIIVVIIGILGIVFGTYKIF